MSKELIRVSYSGGADSTALAIYLKDQGHEIELVFADTGAELPETYWIIPRVARELGCKIYVVNGPTMFRQLVMQGFFLPGWRVRWCTRELKGKPLNEWFKDHPGPMAVGIRADEEHRAHRPKNAPKATEYLWPLIDGGFDKSAVLKLCESRGLLNPCYQWRTNCSCFCCPFQRKQDWLNLHKYHPDLYALAEDWEELSMHNSLNAKFTWNDSFGLRDLRVADEAQLNCGLSAVIIRV